MTTTALAPQERLSTLLEAPAIRGRFENMLGKRSASFMSSIISSVNGNAKLKECDPMTVIAAAAIAASMDLPINPSLGFAHIVPYKGVAQFQIGWKGIVQLAQRSGQYKTINLTTVLEGQIKKHDRFTGEMEFNETATSDKVVGYLLYFKLLSGFEKFFYMSAEQMHSHGKRYSKSYTYNTSTWQTDFDSMGLKTVAKLGLGKFGPLSIEMQTALEVDQAEVDENGRVKSYPDAVDAETTTPAPAGVSRMDQVLDAASTGDSPAGDAPVTAGDIPL